MISPELNPKIIDDALRISTARLEFLRPAGQSAPQKNTPNTALIDDVSALKLLKENWESWKMRETKARRFAVFSTFLTEVYSPTVINAFAQTVKRYNP